MSIVPGPSFRANESIGAFLVVALNPSTTAEEFRIELADTSTSAIIGVIQDNVSTDGSAEVVTFGMARAQCGASVSIGLISWQTATGKIINIALSGTTITTRLIGTALQPGSTDSVIKIIVNPQLIPNL